MQASFVERPRKPSLPQDIIVIRVRFLTLGCVCLACHFPSSNSFPSSTHASMGIAGCAVGSRHPCLHRVPHSQLEEDAPSEGACAA